MIERHIEIKTSEGQMGTFICHPEEGGPFPAIFFFMDAPGKREELHDMARRLATTGYYVVLPNLYYRTTDHFELDFPLKSQNASYISSVFGQLRRATKCLSSFSEKTNHEQS